ncbi:hypothetical protein HAX54_046517, partial [Datura stramonium]|nr:hypothetical protein [Datura stramonium]
MVKSLCDGHTQQVELHNRKLEAKLICIPSEGNVSHLSQSPRFSVAVSLISVSLSLAIGARLAAQFFFDRQP